MIAEEDARPLAETIAKEIAQEVVIRSAITLVLEPQIPQHVLLVAIRAQEVVIHHVLAGALRIALHLVKVLLRPLVDALTAPQLVQVLVQRTAILRVVILVVTHVRVPAQDPLVNRKFLMQMEK